MERCLQAADWFVRGVTRAVLDALDRFYMPLIISGYYLKIQAFIGWLYLDRWTHLIRPSLSHAFVHDNEKCKFCGWNRHAYLSTKP